MPYQKEDLKRFIEKNRGCPRKLSPMDERKLLQQIKITVVG